MKGKLSHILIAALILAASSLAFASGKKLYNLDKQGVALEGYDAVAFFTDNRPVKGQPQFRSDYDGATYYFASADHKAQFDAAPAKYQPQFGGYCAYGASKGDLVTVEIDAFQIYNGRLLMQYSKSVREKFNKDPENNLKRADQNWPQLVEKNGK